MYQQVQGAVQELTMHVFGCNIGQKIKNKNCPACMKKDNLLTVVYMTCNLILPDMHNFYYIGYCQVKQIHSKQFVTIPHLYF